MWRIREAVKAFIFRLRHPITQHHPTWGPFDHSHICMAARVLDEKSFIEVCPRRGRCKIDYDDACDKCDYMRIIIYGVNSDGQKYVNGEAQSWRIMKK